MTSVDTLRLPERIVADVAGYRAGVARFQNGELHEVAFRAFRVPMGVYEQRTSGHYMVRVRLGAGLASPEQLERIAALSAAHGDGVLHVTTRQDIQIHHVSLEGTIAVQEGLVTAGLSARGGGGNTVRNVTACPRSLVCPKAKFDVAPHALATAEYLLQLPRSFGLPRKYKIAFSGCSEDCAFAAVNDLGFFARERDGQPGFAVYAGGGLGPQAAAGISIEEFVPVAEIFLVAEAIERLFDRLGDRANKHQARLRYVLRRLGPAAFTAEYRTEREALAREGLSGAIPSRPIVVAEGAAASTEANDNAVEAAPDLMRERKGEHFTLRLRLENGHIAATDLLEVARVARELGMGLVAATQQQDLLVLGIPGPAIDAARRALAGIGLDTRPARPKLVACAGASTCKLGICLSPALAKAVDERLQRCAAPAGRGFDTIRISGCPNACGNHVIAGLGFEGCARRHGGRLLPLYEVSVGGQAKEGDVRFGERLGTVPARAIPDLVADIHGAGAMTAAEIRPFVEHWARLPESVPEDFYVDHGAAQAFSLAGRGPGECGAGVLDIVRVDLDDARDALAASEHATGHERSARIHQAITASASALLPLFGVEERKERAVSEAAVTHLVKPGWVTRDTEALLGAALDWRLGDRPSLEDLLPRARLFHQRVRELFGSLDGNLRFRLQPLGQAATSATPSPAGATKSIDLRGVKCPMNFVKAKVALERLAVGDTLDVLLDDGEPIRNVPGSFREQGQDVVAVSGEEQHFRLRVRRNK